MLRFVTVLSLVALARAGAPIAYGAPGLSYAAPAVTAVHSAVAPVGIRYAQAAPVVQQVRYAQPVQQVYARPAVQAIHAAPVAHAVAAPVRAEPFDPHPQYQFGYSVSDQLTGDQHSHHESRDGDVVQGEYSLVEPDGAIRTVRYTSDPVNGFNAVVDRQRPAVAVAKAPVAVAHPVAHVAPAVTAVHAAQYAPTYAAHHPVTYATAGHPGLSYAAPAVHAVHSAVPAGVAYHHG